MNKAISGIIFYIFGSASLSLSLASKEIMGIYFLLPATVSAIIIMVGVYNITEPSFTKQIKDKKENKQWEQFL